MPNQQQETKSSNFGQLVREPHLCYHIESCVYS